MIIDFENKYGIYQIVCIANEKIYIGSSKTVRQRLINHRGSLRLNKHQNIHLQRAFNKYGEEAFEAKIVEYIELESNDVSINKKNLLEREQFYIDLYNSYNLGFNRMPQATSPLGRKYTKEEAEKRALNKRPAWNKGIPRTEEQKRYHSDITKGRKGWNKGVPRREDLKLHQREQASGKKAILALDKQTKEIVHRFNSLGDASRELGLSRGLISYYCKKDESEVKTIKHKHNIDFNFIFENN